MNCISYGGYSKSTSVDFHNDSMFNFNMTCMCAQESVPLFCMNS